MKQITIFCKVGRADPQALATFDYADKESADQACNAIQGSKTHELLASGVALNRVEFSREVVDVKDPEEKAPVVGKRR